MTKLNGQIHTITYLNPSAFSADLDTSGEEYQPYIDGGVFTKIKEPTKLSFTSLEAQMNSPDLLINDLSKLDSPPQCLIGIMGMHRCLSKGVKMEELNCSTQMNRFLTSCEDVKRQLKNVAVEKLDVYLLRCLADTCGGKLAPLCAAIGGIAAQEVLKGLSGKFTPLKQWLLLDAIELCSNNNSSSKSQSDSKRFCSDQSDSKKCDTDQSNKMDGCSDRYTQLSKCVSPDIANKVRNTKLFTVGCGAIGCEMLKNYALLGVGSGTEGVITITDNDLIEKSNLNRQFLFRPWHIQVRM